MRLRDPMVLIATGNCDVLPSIDRLLEKQRLAAAGRFHFAICPFADDQIGLDRNGDALQLAGAIERFDELRERAVSHLRNVIRFNDRQQPDCA